MPRNRPPPAAASRRPHGAGNSTTTATIGTVIWTRLRTTWRSHHVSVVVSCSTQPRWDAGSRPPKAYQSHRWGAGRTTGSADVPRCPSGPAMTTTLSCSARLTPRGSPTPIVGAPNVGEHTCVPPLPPRGLRRRSGRRRRRQRPLGRRAHPGERPLQRDQLLHRHAEPLDDAGGDLLRLGPQRCALL